MIKRSTIVHFLIIFVLTISCASQRSEGQETLAQPRGDMEFRGNDQKTQPSLAEDSKNYKPGEVLVGFHDGTDNSAIEAIQKDLHLESIRIVSRPNLYLMKIIDGSSVESVIKRLRSYREVHYAEPNYIRRIN